jgi:hypothetical protein
MTAMRDELASMRSNLEPLGDTAESIERFRRRLPGNRR